MQYTDNEAALIRPNLHLFSSSGCIRCAEGFLYPRSGTSAHRSSFRGRSSADSKGADVPDTDLSDVPRSAARPDGRQSQDNGVASFLPLTLRSIFITSLTVSEGFFGGGFLLLIYYIVNA